MRKRLVLWGIVGALFAIAPFVRADDVATAKALIARADKAQDGDVAASARLYEKALALAPLASARDVHMEARRGQCWSSAVAEEKLAFPVAAQGLAEARSVGDRVALADLQLCRGYASEVLGNVNDASRDYDAAVAEAARSGNQKVWADALALRGEMAHYRGQFNRAIEDLQKAYSLNVALNRPGKQHYTLNAIANLYADRRVGAYDRAIQYYRQLLAGDEKTGSVRGMATGRFNIAATLESKGDLVAALAEYRRALALERQRKDPDAIADVQRAMGIVLGKLGKNDEALKTLDAALARFVTNGDEESAATARLARGSVLRKLGRPGEGIRELEAARGQFEQTGSNRFLEKTHEERALALAALGDWRSAYEARGAQLELRQKLSEQLREEHVSQLRVQFETEKTERENRALVRENALRARALADASRIRRLQAGVIVLGGLVIGFLIYLVVRHLATARRMRDLALTDELTKLPNRRHLLTFADEILRASRASGTGFSMLALDIDHFKRVNDTYGHDAGDIVLRRVAETCRGALRQHDRIGRTGGEEFLVVLPETDGRVAAEVAERLRAAVERTDFSDIAPDLRITISLGATEWSASDDFTTLVKRADDYLYQAKESGRNRVVPAYA
jgi:diguanylate cyclase (GGDEF)-like protein